MIHTWGIKVIATVIPAKKSPYNDWKSRKVWGPIIYLDKYRTMREIKTTVSLDEIVYLNNQPGLLRAGT